MSARWQQWFPFHIDSFRGSPAVQAMHPSARAGYLYLLSHQWQSEDGTLPGDDASLCELSGIGTQLWGRHRASILRKFSVGLDKRLKNIRLDDERREAKRIFEARQAAALRTTSVRSYHGDRTVTDGRPSRSADTITGTDTDTTTKTKTKPSRAKRASGEVKHSGDLRHVACKAEIFAYYQAKNQTDPEWNGREGKALGMLLGANPKLTAEGIKRLLGFRGQSDVNHAERPGKWIENLGSYRAGPLDKFGKPKGATNGNGYYRSKTDGNAEAARQAIAELDGESSDLFGAGETGRVIEGDVEGLRPGTGGIR